MNGKRKPMSLARCASGDYESLEGESPPQLEVATLLDFPGRWGKEKEKGEMQSRPTGLSR